MSGCDGSAANAEEHGVDVASIYRTIYMYIYIYISAPAQETICTSGALSCKFSFELAACSHNFLSVVFLRIYIYILYIYIYIDRNHLVAHFSF